MQERLVYDFANQTDHSIDINLDWERWRFPIHVEVDLKATVLEDIRRQMSGAIGFDPASLKLPQHGAWIMIPTMMRH